MNWKRSLIACISIGLLLFPYNIIGCADGEAPYDYYVSFFHKRMDGKPAYDPFSYTNLKFLYGDGEAISTEQETAGEWTGYGRQQFSREDAYQFMCKFTARDIAAVTDHIRKKGSTKLRDTLQQNGMTRYLIAQKDTVALKYIAYAKLVEPQVAIDYNSWEPITRDVKKMNQLINAGRAMWKQSSHPFLKLRYAYQSIRLAFYSEQLNLCMTLFNEMKPDQTGTGVIRDLSVGIKAGVLFRTGRKAAAAYEYSRLFGNTDIKKMSNYLSFYWAVRNMNAATKTQALQLCRNNSERATLKGMMLLNSANNELAALTDVYKTDPNAAINALLITREINKLEEFYLTPSLSFDKGVKSVYIAYNEHTAGSPEFNKWKKEAEGLLQFCRLNSTGTSTHQPLYTLAGAHLAVILRNDTAATRLLELARKSALSPLQKDQFDLTQLVHRLRMANKMSVELEEVIYGALPWLQKKAEADPEFARFYRRIFSDLLPPLYKQSGQTDFMKYSLCLSVADSVNQKYLEEKGEWGYYGGSRNQIREQLNSEQAGQLALFMESKQLRPFEKFLVTHSMFTKQDANDLTGTLYLRKHDFQEAIKWLRKVPASYYKNEVYSTYLDANTFADHIADIHSKTAQDTVTYTKLQFAQRMIELGRKAAVETDNEKKAKWHYELALGYYNITYWGNSWLMVHYGWSSTEFSEWQPAENYKEKMKQEYFSAYRSRQQFEEALQRSGNKEFQARCLFQIARCDQKRVGPIPQAYSDDKTPYVVRMKNWLKQVDQQNGVFSRLHKDYADTRFYREAYNTCSYLQDFITQQK